MIFQPRLPGGAGNNNIIEMNEQAINIDTLQHMPQGVNGLYI